MERARLTPHKKQEDGAPLVAEMVRQASRSYEKFWNDLDLKPQSEEADQAGSESLRCFGAMFSARLWGVNQVVQEEDVDLNGKSFPPPPVVTALRELYDSYTLISTVRNYEDLLNQPLVPWEEIREKLDAPESREWMKKALAAY